MVVLLVLPAPLLCLTMAGAVTTGGWFYYDNYYGKASPEPGASATLQ